VAGTFLREAETLLHLQAMIERQIPRALDVTENGHGEAVTRQYVLTALASCAGLRNGDRLAGGRVTSTAHPDAKNEVGSEGVILAAS